MLTEEEKDKAIVEGLKVVAPLLEASGKESARLLKECRDFDVKRAYIKGIEDGIYIGGLVKENEMQLVLGFTTERVDIERMKKGMWEDRKKQLGC